MVWYFYGTVLAASFINWGYLATAYNINNKQGSFNFHKSLNYNDKLLLENYHEEFNKAKRPSDIKKEQTKTFLSKIIYYQTIKLPK